MTGHEERAERGFGTPAFSRASGWAGLALLLLSVALFLQAFGSLPAAHPVVAVDSEPALPGLEALSDLQERIRAVHERVAPAIVGIEAGANRGSGVIVSPDGLVFTAAHVFEREGARLTVHLASGRTITGVGEKLDTVADAGYIRLDPDEAPAGGFPYVEPAPSNSVHEGDWCLAFGHPGGFRRDRSAVMRLGNIGDVGRGLIRTDAAIQSGDSGGPLFDLDGRVIGVHSRIFSRLTANFHVPVDVFRRRWPDLRYGPVVDPEAAIARADGDVESARLSGANHREGAESLAARPRPFLGVQLLEHSDGCEIELVFPGSGAAEAGLRIGDIIESIDGVPLRRIRQLQARLALEAVGESVKLEVRRRAERVVADVVLKDRAAFEGRPK